jgi:GTP-binding protein
MACTGAAIRKSGPVNSFRIVLLGRPNAGKSRLFNRMAGEPVALVCDYEGLTRDWQEAPCVPPFPPVSVLDTPGVVPEGGESLSPVQQRMNEQTLKAAQRADAFLFLVDGRSGITHEDIAMARWLRHFFRHHPARPVQVLVNKAESLCSPGASSSVLAEARTLGWGDGLLVSAEHGHGTSDLAEVLCAWSPEHAALLAPVPDEPDSPENEEAPRKTRPVRIVLMGRPNAGKSTLTNAFLGEERVMTGPEAGLTRDAIALPWSWQGHSFVLVDTAGQRRRSRITEAVERMAFRDGDEALRYADAAVVVVDASGMGEDGALDKQDLDLARKVLDEGRVLVLALNKWDQVARRKDRAFLKTIQHQLDGSLGALKGVRWFPVSALGKDGLGDLLEGLTLSCTAWNKRVPTAALNRWLSETVRHCPPPAAGGIVLRARYITQIKARPPTFRLFVSRAGQWPESYMRYITNQLRADFGMEGLPIRLQLRQADNPYT